ncbi:hypothetical protein HHI36_021600 [Cryptolaemus montrouzieri]|uniref:RING-type domain-containing protein n=1 Tax=Cryptolaemus montrouzieri TaxID=559131 RepID=A0ABD2MXI1_9CUCU
MYRAKKPLISNLNEHLVCNICKGYFIDATTIIECLHTFCRSCIVKYLETTKYCPVCDVQVHKTKPLLSLRPDKIIQDLVYKLVPRLFNNELASYYSILTPEEELCVTLNYYGSISKPRYLRCPSAVSIMHLQKLIRAKFGLSDSHYIDILHNQDCLNPFYTLMDVIYIYKLSKMEPLDLTYRIYEYMAKKMKLEHKESKTVNQTDMPSELSHSNNNNWKEVQLRISENGEMSITGIQDGITSENFTPELIEVLDTKPKPPTTTYSANPVKKKEIPDLKFMEKPIKTSKNITILSNETLIPFNIENRLSEPVIPKVGNKDICSIVTAVSVPCIKAATTTVFSTINSMKCSVGTPENSGKTDETPNLDGRAQEGSAKDETKPANDRQGVKRKWEQLNNDSSKKPNNIVAKKNDVKTTDVKMSPVRTTNDVKANHVRCDEKPENQGEGKLNSTNEIAESKTAESVVKNENHDVRVPSGGGNEAKSVAPLQSVAGSNNNSRKTEEIDVKTSKNSCNPSSAPPKPSTKYQGPTQPCYMPKTTYNPIINVPKPLQSTSSTSKSEVKTSSKSVMNVKNEVKVNSVPNTCSVATNSSNSPVTNSKVNISLKPKSSTPMGYKTLRDPPKSWNSQISKANLSKPPDPKYSDLKNVRPAKFFKMRNNMLRFLGNPASGVKPMYSVHVSPEKEKPPEKIVENREIKKHSIVKIDPKTLKPISEKAPETSSLSSQVSATADLKINTSSVSIFNPLKLQSNSPKSDRKSPKSPQSPKPKTTSSPSPPVPKRDKPNLNFTPPNPFVPNLSSQTVNPNQFLCNTGPPGFPSYDPRVMAAAYHNLFYGPSMGFPPAPLPYHLGGLDINQRGKGFDISKIVGMQQQQQHQRAASKSPVPPQGPSSKLEAPSVPPQIPYQPRPSPMSLKPQNSSIINKRPLKDPSKNEKSLQNTVEKLTLSRAKEIHKATEILNKTNSSSCRVSEEKKEAPVENKEKPKTPETTRIPQLVDNKPKENRKNTSPEETKNKEKLAETEKNSLVSPAGEWKETNDTNTSKSETISENGKCQSQIAEKRVEKKNERKGAEKCEGAKKDGDPALERTCVDDKNSIDNNNAAKIEAGSVQLERVAGRTDLI